MSLHSFRSLKNPAPVKREWTEEQIVATARGLLEEHARRREEASLLVNQVCGNCTGAGTMPSTLMEGETVACFACEGTGKPNDKIQAVPELLPEDHDRMWKIQQLLLNFPKYRGALLAVIREYFPDLYRQEEQVN